jgi:hypothetical protein
MKLCKFSLEKHFSGSEQSIAKPSLAKPSPSPSLAQAKPKQAKPKTKAKAKVKFSPSQSSSSLPKKPNRRSSAMLVCSFVQGENSK